MWPFKKKIHFLGENTPHEGGYAPLYILVTIVNDGQAPAIIKICENKGASFSFTCRGKGTANSDFYEVFSFTQSDKQLIFTPIRCDMYPDIKAALTERFEISDGAKGVAALLPVSSIIGKNAYRLLSDERVNLNAKGAKEIMDKTDMEKNFELIVAIVNDSYTDLVMDAAKAAGARGGTIFNARGTGNKDIESFYGIVITPEKQVVLILVPKDIRDNVVSAIYKNAGLQSKGQGIVFTLPTTDVLGVMEERNEETKPEEETKIETETKTDVREE